MESALYGIFHTRWFCIRNLTRSISDTSPTRVKIPYARALHEVISIYRSFSLSRNKKMNRPFYSYGWKRGWGCLVLIQPLSALLWKLFLKHTSQHKDNLIDIIKQEGLYENKVTLSLASIHNCKMAYWKPSSGRSQETECYKRLVFKQFVQVSGLCGPHFLSYLPKRFTHICRALYGDAILVHRFAAPIWPPEINKNIWSSLFP